MTRFIIKNEQEAKKLGISKGEWELMKMEQKENKTSTRKNKYNNKDLSLLILLL